MTVVVQQFSSSAGGLLGWWEAGRAVIALHAVHQLALLAGQARGRVLSSMMCGVADGALEWLAEISPRGMRSSASHPRKETFSQYLSSIVR